MVSDIREFVMQHPLFCHHDHHRDFKDFDREREEYDYRSMLGYAGADFSVTAGARPAQENGSDEWYRENWKYVRTTGYGRAVTHACRELFGLEFEPENFGKITEALQKILADRTAPELYDYCVREMANNRWVLQDSHFWVGREKYASDADRYPDYYRFAWRMDDLFAITDAGPVSKLEQATGRDILDLDDLVGAMHAGIDVFKPTGKLAAFKVGMAYQRDLVVGDPTRAEAESAFNRIRGRKSYYEGLQQNEAPLNAVEARPLGDYLLHRLLKRAHDEDMPVQIHTGYLAGTRGALAGTKALQLVPIFEKYRKVRFDIFHASWPWTSELGAVAKNYPNVYPDLCWAWTMNPAETERALGEWLDGVPYNKIFGYGADTGLPWGNVGYSMQARLGIARVLQRKIEKGFFSESTARDVARAIMLENGERFFGLSA